MTWNAPTFLLCWTIASLFLGPIVGRIIGRMMR